MLNRKVWMSSFLLFSYSAIADEGMTSHNHTTLEVIQSEQQNSEALAKQSAAVFFPELSFVGGYKEENFKTDPKKGAVAYLNFDWKIYDGGKSWADFQLSKAQLKTAQFSTEKKKRDLYLTIFKLKSKLIELEKVSEIEKFEVKTYQDQLVAAQRRMNSGLTSESDVLEIQIQQQETQEHILELAQEQREIQSQIEALGVGISENEISDFEGLKSMNLENHQFEKTVQYYEQINQLNEVDAKSMGDYSELLPKLTFNAQYGVIDPQDYSSSSKKETAVAVLLNVPLFSGGRGYAGFKAARADSMAKDHRVRMDVRVKKSNFEVKLARWKELKRLIDVHKNLEDRSARLVQLVSAEYKRGVKDSSALLSATQGWVEVQKKLLNLRTEQQQLDMELRLM